VVVLAVWLLYFYSLVLQFGRVGYRVRAALCRDRLQTGTALFFFCKKGLDPCKDLGAVRHLALP
jgi:hypothetical protein